MTGGLAAALLPIVENSGAIWVGSSGRVRDGGQEPFAEIESLGAGALAMLDLPAAHYGGYYEGFANSGVWPALHSQSLRSEEHTSELQSHSDLVCRLLLEKKKQEKKDEGGSWNTAGVAC